MARTPIIVSAGLGGGLAFIFMVVLFFLTTHVEGDPEATVGFEFTDLVLWGAVAIGALGSGLVAFLVQLYRQRKSA